MVCSLDIGWKDSTMYIFVSCFTGISKKIRQNLNILKILTGRKKVIFKKYGKRSNKIL